jgi:hypothetical protein
VSAADKDRDLRQGTLSFMDPAVGQLNVPGVGSCTASLVDPQAIVTAAHCVGYRTGAMSGTFRIDLGANSSQTFDIAEAKSFGSGVGNDDVAVVRLSSAVPSNVAVPFKLSFSAVISMGQRVTMYGYGCRTARGDSYSGQKQRLETNYSGKLYSCFGDSGGPLIVSTLQPGHTGGYRTISKVFSGWTEYWMFEWRIRPEYGIVHSRAPLIADQYDQWAGRPPGSSGIAYPRPGGEPLTGRGRKQN